MVLIENVNSHDPAFNLALEEFCLLNLPMDRRYLLFYTNSPSIVVGKHQNVFQEVDTDLVQERRIPVLRRISGGGTVFHDLGNLNFSFIQAHQHDEFNNYAHFTGAIAKVLASWGVPAELTERGDITVEGRKVSGSAQAMRSGRLDSHGTLLFRSDLALISPILKPKPGTFTSKSRPSVRSQVANIGNWLPQIANTGELAQRIAEALAPDPAGIERFLPGPAQLDEVEALAETKYRSWEWNYARSPMFTVERERPIGGRPVAMKITVEKGMISEAFFPKDPGLQPLSYALAGIPYRPGNIRPLVEATLPNWPHHEKEALLHLLY